MREGGKQASYIEKRWYFEVKGIFFLFSGMFCVSVSLVSHDAFLYNDYVVVLICYLTRRGNSQVWLFKCNFYKSFYFMH